MAEFTWQAAVAIAYTLLWNIGLCIFNTKNPIWRTHNNINLVLVTNGRHRHSRPQTWFAWDLISAKDLVSAVVSNLLAFLLLLNPLTHQDCHPLHAWL